MMTKKHYKKIAEVFSNLKYPSGDIGLQLDARAMHKALAEELAKVFSKDNPRFDYKRFMAACGYGE